MPLNVQDKYRGWEVDLIREDAQKNALPFAVCMENWDNNFNLATLVRNANAFSAKEVFYLQSSKKWDRRGAVGTHNYTHVQHLSSVEQVVALREKYPHIVGVDCIAGKSVSMRAFTWPKNCLLVFGSEADGLTPEMQAICDSIVEIPMTGTVRSLNAATASGITLYDLTMKWSME